MAVKSRGDLASRHGRIVRIAGAHSGFYRSDNPICTRTPNQILGEFRNEVVSYFNSSAQGIGAGRIEQAEAVQAWQ